MKKLFKSIISLSLIMLVVFSFVACGKKKNDDPKCDTPEKVTLAKVVLDEVEFENAETVKLEQDCSEVVVSGKIDAMSASQKSAYGVDSVTHVVGVKFMFDKERTLKTFEIKGNTTKVYSSDNTLQNYAGALSDLLDNGAEEDAYTNIVLSANTKDYILKVIYTDGVSREIKIHITATLATAEAE